VTFKTEQENFWAGEFGDEYLKRNRGEKPIAANIALFSKVLQRTNGIESIIEFGANIGLNLEAISLLRPQIKMSAIEINQNAVESLKRFDNLHIHHSSILDFIPDRLHDLVLIKGVLIHINPEELSRVYDLLYQSCGRYICIAEYYNPTPVELGYRGHTGKLFKRDFAGEMLDKYPDLTLLDYGFAYHRDNSFPQDDITWFLLEKTN
jgi:pseudaminic acid biosynthesis-associated methylase